MASSLAVKVQCLSRVRKPRLDRTFYSFCVWPDFTPFASGLAGPPTVTVALLSLSFPSLALRPPRNAHLLQRVPHRQIVPVHPQPRHNAHGLIAEVAMVPEALARIHVGDVHLDEGDRDAHQGIADGDAGVRVCARVDHDCLDALALGGVDPVDEGALRVGLEVGEGGAGGGAEGGALGDHVGKGGGAVSAGVRTEEIAVCMGRAG